MGLFLVILAVTIPTTSVVVSHKHTHTHTHTHRHVLFRETGVGSTFLLIVLGFLFNTPHPLAHKIESNQLFHHPYGVGASIKQSGLFTSPPRQTSYETYEGTDQPLKKSKSFGPPVFSLVVVMNEVMYILVFETYSGPGAEGMRKRDSLMPGTPIPSIYMSKRADLLSYIEMQSKSRKTYDQQLT